MILTHTVNVKLSREFKNLKTFAFYLAAPDELQNMCNPFGDSSIYFTVFFQGINVFLRDKAKIRDLETEIKPEIKKYIVD